MKKDNIWIGVGDLTNDSTFIEQSKQEFFELPIIDALSEDVEVIESATQGTSRRDFLKYLGFGLGAATVAASCDIPVRKALPYVTKPDAIVPGVATYYASSFVKGGDYCSILVKTREGRPIKIEGNSLSSVTKGGTSARAQASVLDLYDKFRLRHAGKVDTTRAIGASKMDWADLDKEITKVLPVAKQIAIVSHTMMSPTLKQAIADFAAKYPNTKVVQYDPISSAGMILANEQSFGQKAIPSYHFDKADVIVNFGADFLGTWISPTEYAADFTSRRKVDVAHPEKMSRLIQFENGVSLTGSNADSRVHIRPSERGAATLALYNAIASKAGAATVSAPKINDKATAAVKAAAEDLWNAKGNCLVVSGSNSTAEQVVVNALNDLLGNYGNTITFDRISHQRQGVDADIQGLIKELESGATDVVFVYGGANPCYDIPNADKFAAALKKAKLSVSLGGHVNETTTACQFVAPDHHGLEGWGDVEPKSGIYSLVQPTITPLFETRSAITSFLTWAESADATNGDQPAYEYLKKNWKASMFGKQSDFLTFQAFWDNTLHDGVFEAAANGSEAAPFAGDVAAAAAKVDKPAGEGIEVLFYESIGVGAGQYAENPWLQEIPDPVTRCVWDNPLQVPIKWDGDNNYIYYKGMTDGDLAELSKGDMKAKLAIVNQFGQMDGTASVALGYGRTEGSPAAKDVGQNVFPMLTIKDGTTRYYTTGADISGKVGRDKDFACVQHHHTLGVTGEYNGETINVDEQVLGHRGYQGSLTNRSIIYTSDATELKEKIEHLEEKRAEAQKLNSHTLYGGHDALYKAGHHWGMSIDMNACIGCSACQVACIAENNVPIVGKKEVGKHHEMTWLRIDRYFYGDVENPNVIYQPMMCQHCDNAPCENVCPVNATNHSSEGLNQMTYNRCIGTRYCANNCPYKVRRFNWLDFTQADLFPWNEPTYKDDETYMTDNLTRMVLNPDVTVRSRGVIEKCSFCVQKIQESKLTAKKESRRLRDGDLKTACQTACPTGAIVFGDTNDPESQVSKLKESDLSYLVLEEINVASSVNYMMRVTNKNETIG